MSLDLYGGEGNTANNASFPNISSHVRHNAVNTHCDEKRHVPFAYMPDLFLSLRLSVPPPPSYPHHHLSCWCWISHLEAKWLQQLWNSDKLRHGAPTHSSYVSGSRFWPSCPLSLQRRTVYKMGPVLFAHNIRACYEFLSPSCSLVSVCLSLRRWQDLKQRLPSWKNCQCVPR